MSRVVFLHPDLGIGGAERAVIDAALALKSRGHTVQFVTAHHDEKHCFQETRDGSFPVTSVGDWLPRSIFGHCYALCAYIRMIYAALFLVLFSSLDFDLVICDQISACIPVLRLSKAKILFYCHFPDMLLTKRESFMKSLYRGPIDWLEEKTTGMAHQVVVNSKFTGCLKSKLDSLDDVHLIMAGGYDERVTENMEHYMELRQLSNELDLDEHITFLRSFTDAEKRVLLHYSNCLLYTPDREHFGIVPIEAMYMQCPVIAVKSGGPLETVEDGATGYLCEATPENFCEAMNTFVKDAALAKRMGTAGRKRVETKFSFTSFTNQLEKIVNDLVKKE